MSSPEYPASGREALANGPDARFDRALERLAASNDRWDRLKALFPGFKKIFLVVALAALSWFATYVGMLELITANAGELPFYEKVFLGIAVAILMTMVVYILDVLFSPLSWWLRTLYVLGYILLTLISIGFSFGFFWKVLESRSEATRSAESAIGQVQTALQSGQVRLEQLQATLDTLTTLSRQKAVEERDKGTTCPNSGPGDGPRRRLRDSDAGSFAFTSNFVKEKSAAVKKEFEGLNGDLAKVLNNDPSTVDASGTRNSFMRGLGRKIDLTIARFNALKTDPQLAEHRNKLAARAEKVSFEDGGAAFQCPDAQLQGALRGVVRALDSLPNIERPNIAAVEGSEATIEAFRRLTTTTIGLLQFKLPPSPDGLRELQRKAVQSAQAPVQAQATAEQQPGLGSRDYIPLFVAIFVDFCLLLVSINRPINRFQMLRNMAREARDGPVIQLLAKFHEIHQGGLAHEFEIFQHVVFDFWGDYYVAVPLSSRRSDARYLANLFVSLEGKGIVDRVAMLPTGLVRRKLARQNSDFADEKLFRLYRFRNGAWSKMVLEAILGAPPPPPASHIRAGGAHAQGTQNGAGRDAAATNGSAPHDAPPPASSPEINGSAADHQVAEEGRETASHKTPPSVLALPGPLVNGKERPGEEPS